MNSRKTVIYFICTALMIITADYAVAESNSDACKNGGFEILDPAGDNFPINWEHNGHAVISKDAHGGSMAVCLSAKGGLAAVLDSDPIEGKKGTVSFWYKAITSDTAGDNLKMCVIGLSMGTEIQRAYFSVPGEHVGDRQWHKGTIDFDFSGDSGVDSIILSTRINEYKVGKEGEWLIDDSECSIELLRATAIAAFYMPDPIMRIGESAEIVIHVVNQGSTAVPSSELFMDVPDGIVVAGGSRIAVEPIPANSSRRFTQQLTGSTPGRVNITARWKVEDAEIKQSRGAVCVEKIEPRRLCTDAEGYWRFMPEPVSLQLGNKNELIPLKTKKSSELPNSYIGVTSHLPRSKDLESIFEPQYLIDGDYQTNWSSCAHASIIPGAIEWIQVDFKKTECINKINLVPYYKSEGFPVDFVIKFRTSRSGLDKGEWKTVYKAENLILPPNRGEGDKVPYTFNLPLQVETDAVRIEATKFRVASGFFCDCGVTYYCRLSEIEIIDQQGKNIAGNAGITVSSTFHSWYNTKDAIAETYKELYNLGVKWNRVGQWGDWTCWAAVEQKKGEYYIDPVMDKAITESVENGVNILYTLDYGNRLYEETPWLTNPGPVWRKGHPFTGDGGPTTPESIQGFVNYAKFVAAHFKGRVKYYEIWNEENSWAWYGSPPSPKVFGTLLRETAKSLKEIDPEIKVCVGGTAALAPMFITEALKEGGGKYLDAIAFHPYGSPYPEIGTGSLDVTDGVQTRKTLQELGIKTYKEMLDYLRKTFAPYNPNFSFWADEWNAIPKREDAIIGTGSEIREAKIAARWYTMATITKVGAIWWTLANQNSIMDWALLRMKDNSKKPAFYVTANMATLLSGAVSDSSIKTSVTGDVPELYCEPMRDRDGKIMIAVWSAIAPDNDDYLGKRMSLKIEAAGVHGAEAVDTLHGLIQELDVKKEHDSIKIDGLLVMDYPIMVKLK